MTVTQMWTSSRTATTVAFPHEALGTVISQTSQADTRKPQNTSNLFQNSRKWQKAFIQKEWKLNDI